jgi:hypothetical protein
MKELVLENIGTIFYLVGCVLAYFLIGKKNFDVWTIIYIGLSWITVIMTLIAMKDRPIKTWRIEQMKILDKICEQLSSVDSVIVKENIKIIDHSYLESETDLFTWHDKRFNDETFIQEGFEALLSTIKSHLETSETRIKETIANTDFELTTYCPYCNEHIDLLENDDEGEMTQLIFSDWDKVEEYFECPECEAEFLIKTIQR